MTVYAVGLIYNDEQEGEVTQIYYLRSTYELAKQKALNTHLRTIGAIVVQKFVVDSDEYFEPEIIKQHERFLRYGTQTT